MKYIDNLLNSITAYRLVLFGTMILGVLGIAFGFTGILPMSGWSMLVSMVILVAAAAISNYTFSWLFKIPVNVESQYVTAYILFLILAPATTIPQGLMIAFAAIAAMAAKYVIALHRRHIFNPAALGAFLIGFSGITAATWWVGSAVMLPAVIVVGFVMARKTRKLTMFACFFAMALVSVLIFNWQGASEISNLVWLSIASAPLVFLGSIMLTEPLTMPPTKKLQILYSTVVGLLYGAAFHVGPIYNTPELSLLIGNLLSYAVSPKHKIVLRLKEKIQMAPLIYEFIFTPSNKLSFKPGQYMEWTLGHNNSDMRGNRRYFTIASSPTEDEVRLGVKIPERASSFKTALAGMQPGDELLAGQLAGDFTLPRSGSKKIVGIAGGIGITPFRSMVKYLNDTKQNHDMVLFYACNNATEFVYNDIFQASQSNGVKIVPVISDPKTVPQNWPGKTGYITKEIIESEVPDHTNRLYYLSGPNVMVDAYKKLLRSMGVNRWQIITDYFPGY